MPALQRRLAPVLGVLLIWLAGCTSDPAPAEKDEVPAVSTTPLAKYDTTSIAVARSPFCDRIAPEAVRDALGDAATKTTEWEDGDRVPLPRGGKDVTHEFGCRYRAASGMTATAWLFAPPVTPDRAQALREDTKDCWRADGDAFGKPSAATRCRRGKAIEVGNRGLFGDAWLACTVGSPVNKEPNDLTERADAWCVQVLEAVRVRD